MENAGYVIGRENEKLIDSNQNKESNLENRAVVDCDESSSLRNAIKRDGLEYLQSIEGVSRNTIKIDDLESLQSVLCTLQSDADHHKSVGKKSK